MSIRLSKKHGLNPTIPVCFWCGKDKNEIVLLGSLPDDKEAPMHVAWDYEPCDECKEKFSQGILVMESTDGRTPTGAHAVVKREAIERMFKGYKALNSAGYNALDKILGMGKVYVDSEAFKRIIGK